MSIIILKIKLKSYDDLFIIVIFKKNFYQVKSCKLELAEVPLKSILKIQNSSKFYNLL